MKNISSNKILSFFPSSFKKDYQVVMEGDKIYLKNKYNGKYLIEYEDDKIKIDHYQISKEDDIKLCSFDGKYLMRFDLEYKTLYLRHEDKNRACSVSYDSISNLLVMDIKNNETGIINRFKIMGEKVKYESDPLFYKCSISNYDSKEFLDTNLGISSFIKELGFDCNINKLTIALALYNNNEVLKLMNYINEVFKKLEESTIASYFLKFYKKEDLKGELQPIYHKNIIYQTILHNLSKYSNASIGYDGSLQLIDDYIKLNPELKIDIESHDKVKKLIQY